MNPYTRYFRRLMIWLGLALGALALFNVLADPYASFGVFPATRLRRGASGGGTRIGKGEMIARHDWDVILLGTSRVQMGLDPGHPAFRGMRAYNAGLPGADFPEIDRAARVAIERGTLKRLILCLDLYSFDPDHEPIPDAQLSLLNPKMNRVEYLVGNLIGLNATKESLLTYGNAWHHRDGNGYPLGLHQNEAKRRLSQSDWVRGYSTLTIPAGPEYSAQWSLSQSSLDELSNLLATASRAGVTVDVVQLPMHVVCLERYFAEDLWPLYEDWLTALTQIVDRHNQAFPAAPIRFWDFCDYESYDADPALEASRWFYDPFHFRPNLGNHVLDRIMQYPGPAEPEQFGVVLTGSNLPAHLADLRSGHTAYYAAHPEIQQIDKAIRADLVRRRLAGREAIQGDADTE